MSADAKAFHDGLVEHGLIVPVGVPGAFGRGAVFEDVLDRLNQRISRVAQSEHAEVYAFPPILDRRLLERVEYMDSFPQLVGTVHSFFGKEERAKALSARIHAGEPWGELMGITDVVLNPAACYPVYPSLAGELPEEGRLVTMTNWVFRHEPSPEPTRMQAFRVRELVRAGTKEACLAWRDAWIDRATDLLVALGLPAERDVAADPFFGRGGRMLMDGQRARRLKFEVLVPVISEAHPTACCSFNYHEAHFGASFGIRTRDGEVAHTACVGFGLERCVMALFKTHGFVTDAWPTAVKDLLWPS